MRNKSVYKRGGFGARGLRGVVAEGLGAEGGGWLGKGVCRVAEVGLRSLTCEGRGGMGGWGLCWWGAQREKGTLSQPCLHPGG